MFCGVLAYLFLKQSSDPWMEPPRCGHPDLQTCSECQAFLLGSQVTQHFSVWQRQVSEESLPQDS